MTVQITADTSQFVSKLAEAQRQWSEFVASLQQVQAASQRIESGMGRMAASVSDTTRTTRQLATATADASKGSVEITNALTQATRSAGILDTALTNLGGIVTRVTGSIGGFISGFVSGAKQMGFWATFLTSVIAVSALRAAMHVIELAGKWEFLEISLSRFLGTVGAAREHISDLMRLAIKTPLPLEQIIEFARMIRAWGFESAATIPMLQVVVDTVAALGGGA
ncbi:MAG: hypothetical protein C4292_02645, partial [Nitrososphaera sp.]